MAEMKLTASHVAFARDALMQAERLLMKPNPDVMDRVDVATTCRIAAQDLDMYCLHQIEIWLDGGDQ